MRKSYPTDLTDSEWQSLKSHLPTPQKSGDDRGPQLPREIMDAIFYILKSGCQWRLLPCELPPWETVYHSSSDDGASMAPAKGCTTRSASACALASASLGGTPNPERRNSS